MASQVSKKNAAVTDFSDFSDGKDSRVERLTKAIETTYHSPAKFYFRSFLQGFLSGFGMVAGFICALLIVAYIVRPQGGLSLLNNYFNKLQEEIAPTVIVPAQ